MQYSRIGASARGLSPVSLLLGAVLLAGVGGCKKELPGHYFEVSLQGVEDGCNDPDVGYGEKLEYRLVYDGSVVSVYMGEDLLGAGTAAGCDIEYASPAWSSRRDDGDIRWRLAGEAVVDRGEGCGGGDDWTGSELIEVISSGDPDVAAGCEYALEVTGTYLGEVE